MEKMVKHLNVHEASNECLRAEFVLGTFSNLSSLTTIAFNSSGSGVHFVVTNHSAALNLPSDSADLSPAT